MMEPTTPETEQIDVAKLTDLMARQFARMAALLRDYERARFLGETVQSQAPFADLQHLDLVLQMLDDSAALTGALAGILPAQFCVGSEDLLKVVRLEEFQRLLNGACENPAMRSVGDSTNKAVELF